MKVPFFDYKNVFMPYRDDIAEITKNIVKSGQFIFGDDLRSFEIACAERSGSNYAAGVANATDALEILLAANDMPEGAEVIISSHTMNATASAIVTSGGVPIPIDIDENGMMDPQKISDAIGSKTWAIMPTQLNGAIAEMREIKDIANRYSLRIFEDSAQAFCAQFEGTNAGNFGDGGVFSFYPAKILGCLGDGGMIVVNSLDVYKKILAIRDHGRGEPGFTFLSGRNSRLDNLQAAYLNYFLNEHFDGWIEKRRTITTIYDDAFAKIEQIKTPRYNHRPGHVPVYQNYEFLVEKRDELKEYLGQKNVGTLIQWGGQSIHKNKTFCQNLTLNETEKYFKQCLMLPLNQTMTSADAYYVAESVSNFYKK